MKNVNLTVKILLGTIICALFLLIFPAARVNADATVGISVSGNTEVGSTITVTISVDGEGNYSGFDGSISYDTNLLKYIPNTLKEGPYSAYFKSLEDPSGFSVGEASISNGTLLTAQFTCRRHKRASVYRTGNYGYA